MPVNTISRPFVGHARKKTVAEKLATRLYHLARRHDDQPAAGPPTTAHPGATPIIVVCISDTHNTKPADLPMGDILVHAGDLSQFGTFAEIQDQLSWLASQPHPHKVVIAGNHDLLLDAAFVATHPDRELDRPGKARSDLEWGDVRYLEHEAVNLMVNERSIRIFGSPWTPRCGSWAFQYENTNAPWEGAIPDGTDLVVVHGPPKAHLDDGGKGCEALLKELWRVRPRVVVCGHIHAGRGEKRLHFDRVDRWYEDAVLGGTWIWAWLSVGCLAIWVLCRTVSKLLLLLLAGSSRRAAKNGGRGRQTQLVNAAVVGAGNNDGVNAVIAVI